MTFGHELSMKEKMNLIEKRGHGFFHHALDDKFHLPIPHKTDNKDPDRQKKVN